jgi:hypothetical protein
MASSTISSLGVILWISTFVLLIFLLYINIYAIVRGGSMPKNVVNSGFASLLEQSKTTTAAANKATVVATSLPSESDNGGGIYNGNVQNIEDMEAEIEALKRTKAELNTELRIGEMEEKVRSMNQALQQWEGEFSNLLQSDRKTKQADTPPPPPPVGESKHRKVDSKDLTGMNILLLYADDWTHHTLRIIKQNH